MRWYWWVSVCYGSVLVAWILFVLLVELGRAWTRLSTEEKAEKASLYGALFVMGILWPIVPVLLYYGRRHDKAEEVVKHVKESQ